MIKSFLTLLILSTGICSASFQGCGEYTLHGVLKKNKSSSFKMVYVVNEGSLSQMVFEFAKISEMYKVVPLLDKPTSINATVLKKMDGTKGILSDVTNLTKRYLNPLQKNEISLKKLKNLNCDI